MHEIAMPRLSDSMEQGTILSWLKDDGEPVRAGEDLVEIETDKATVTYAAEHGGTLEVLAVPGETLPVGAPIARVGEQVAAGRAVPAAAPVESSAATPLARRVASAHGVDVAAVAGTGPRGRVTRADVLAAAGEPVPAPSPASAAPVVAPSRIQRTVARRTAEAKATIPEFGVQTEVRADALLALRAQLRAAAGDGAPVPSVNDLVLKAFALALRAHPRVNASYADEGFVLHEGVHVGFAVAADDALVVPVVPDADRCSLGDLARRTRALAERVRAGTITPPELAGGTFTVSNLGMFGMTAITPIINPPQAAIAGVGALRATLAREDGAIVDRTLLTLTLVADHRILGGADAARFLSDVRELLEQPLRLVL